MKSLIHTLVARVAPAYTARVQFAANRDFHNMQAAMREADLQEKRDQMRTMFISHQCAAELGEQWFKALSEGQDTAHFPF